MQDTRRPLDLALALGSGGLLTLMILCNGTVAGHTTGLFGALAAHATGTVSALLLIAVLPKAPVRTAKAPLWAYFGGLCGAITVMLSSIAMNSPLALSGTIALGLAGQTVLGLMCDRFGWFGLPRRRIDARDLGTLALILAGCLVLIFGA